MYKITMHGKTFVGNNEDHWNANTRMWFEKGSAAKYGCMYIGYDNMYPQGAMNDQGLMYDGFAMDEYVKFVEPKKPVFKADMMDDIMTTCKNVNEVRDFLTNYDLISMRSGMVMFVDRSGAYLVVQADTLILGNDANYLLSNFCPARTPDLDAVNIPFYQKGRKLMRAKVDTSLSYLTSLSDTLHQEWPLNGAGTLYTTIYDLNAGIIHLYFYHDYSQSLSINLQEQLSKADTVLVIPALFPANAKGQDQFEQYNRTKDFIKSLASNELAADSASLSQAIKSKELKSMPGFFANEIEAVATQFLKEKKSLSAINLFRLNVKYSAHLWTSYSNLANAYRLNKQYALASLYYEKALKLNPDSKDLIKAKRRVDRRL
jgi:hypothetical protein